MSKVIPDHIDLTSRDAAELGGIAAVTDRLAPVLDEFLRFDDVDSAVAGRPDWTGALQGPLPEAGAGLDAVLDDLERWVIPNGMRSPHPGFVAYVIGRATTSAVAAGLAAQVSGHFRYFLTSFGFLEQLSLDWLADLCGVRPGSYGVYSSGGSTANLLAMGAARQAAFEGIGVDVAADGLLGSPRACIYGGTEVHHTINRAAGVLGLGRRGYRVVESDSAGHMDPGALDIVLTRDREAGVLPVAVVAIGGATATGAVDDIDAIADVATKHGVWLHVDGAYGLFANAVPELKAMFSGLERADSAIVDPHKWLGTPTGCAVTFVRDGDLMERAFTQDPAPYLESFSPADAQSQFDEQGPHWFDRSIELSAPSRGVVVWAVLREIGAEGVRDRVRRHVGFAQHLAQRARQDPRLELMLEPELSICCFRYVGRNLDDATTDQVNEEIQQLLRAETPYIPSTARVDGRLALRPCFINPATTLAEVDGLVDAVLELGDRVTRAATP